MEDAKQAYDAFNRLWQKVPRSVRTDRENHQKMLEVRAYFDAILEAAKRAAIVNTARTTTGALQDPNDPNSRQEEPEEEVTTVHLAMRLLRTLDAREWEIVKTIVEMRHKFESEDFHEILDVIHDTDCPRCGEWLDDDDAHEDCPVPEEDVEENVHEKPQEVPAATASFATPASMPSSDE